ncbi:MAG: MarR family transcriptional regulator [Burkholderiaceae bacterium]|nr:MarR family transcriptional regulator [Burkholderiaceae bacterium]
MTSAAMARADAALRKPRRAAPAAAFFTPETFRPEQGVLYLLRKAMVRLSQSVNREMAMEESTLPQWLPLFKVWKCDASTVADLARQCCIDVSAMTRLLDRLEKKGLVRRARCAADRRVVRIVITPEGQAVAERVPAVLCGVYNRALAGFTAQEWAQLQSLAERLRANAEAMAQELGVPT